MRYGASDWHLVEDDQSRQLHLSEPVRFDASSEVSADAYIPDSDHASVCVIRCTRNVAFERAHDIDCLDHRLLHSHLVHDLPHRALSVS